jgi:membrane protein YdbS with pleckstrin-like domain
VTPEPTRTLSPRARLIWRVRQGAFWTVVLIAALIFAGRLDGALAVLARVLPVAGLLVGTTVVPALRWRRWRWDVRPEAIDIRRGTWTVRRTLIPMLRVQHVDTSSGPIEQQLQLATVTIHTAAGSHTVPLLAERDAGELRDRIADLALDDGDGP